MAVLVPLGRINRKPCLTDEIFQCLALLESNILNVAYTPDARFQRTSAGEDELHIRQFLTDLVECADALFLGKTAEVQGVVLPPVFTECYPPDKL